LNLSRLNGVQKNLLGGTSPGLLKGTKGSEKKGFRRRENQKGRVTGGKWFSPKQIKRGLKRNSTFPTPPLQGKN